MGLEGLENAKVTIDDKIVDEKNVLQQEIALRHKKEGESEDEAMIRFVEEKAKAFDMVMQEKLKKKNPHRVLRNIHRNPKKLIKEVEKKIYP